jgi:hypothetical protein
VVFSFLTLSEGELLEVVELLLDGDRLAVIAVSEDGVLHSDPRFLIVGKSMAVGGCGLEALDHVN